MRRGIRRSASVPNSPSATGNTDAEIERGDRSLLASIEREFDRVAGTAGGHLLCAAGCCDCCHGPFPITRLDVRRLRRGLEETARRDPARAARISKRAAEAVDALTPDFPGEATRGELRSTPAVLDTFFARHSALACPALDSATGRCELYEWRPVACRTYGPPARFANERAEPCALCFREADDETLERCRLEPDREGREQALLDAIGVPAGEEWETLIAFALVGPEI